MTRSTINSRSIEGIGSIDATGTVTAAGLTVDTDTLHIDSTNNRVGIGDSSPSAKLVLRDSSDFKFVMSKTGASAFEIANNGTSGTALTVQDGYPLIFGTNNTERMRIDSSGNVGIGTNSVDNKLHLENAGSLYLQIENTSTANKFYVGNSGGNAILESTGAYSMNFKTDSTERMRIDSSGNVGIGTASPLRKLDVSNSGAEGFEFGPGNASDQNQILHYNRSTSSYIENNNRAGSHTWDIISTEAMRIDSSGNVGIGVTPSAWSVSGVLQSGRVSLSGGANATGGTLNWNAYYDGSWKYKDSLEASQYNFTNGIHVWSYAGTGTADGAITWSEAMRIESNGTVNIGTPNSATAGSFTVPKLYLKAASDSQFSIAHFEPAADTSVLALGYNATDNVFTFGTSYRSSGGYRDLEFLRLAQPNSSVLRLPMGNSTEVVFNEDSLDIDFRVESDGEAHMLFVDGGNNRVGIANASPQKPLDVVSDANDFVTVGARGLGINQWTGIHFGYRENNASYRKSAIVFERTDLTANDAQGKIHILNGPQGSGGSATLADAKITIAENGNVGIGDSSPASLLTVNKGNVTGAGQWASSAIAIANPTNIGAYSQISFGYTAASNASAYIGYVSTDQGANGYGDLVFGTRSVNTNTQPSERMRIAASGKIQVGGDSWGVAITNHPGNNSSTQYSMLPGMVRQGGVMYLGFNTYFPNTVGNLAVRLYIPTYSLWCCGEIIIGSTYSNAPAQGFRRYLFQHNRNTTSDYGTSNTNTDNFGQTSTHFSFNGSGYDTSESAHYFEFRHLQSSGNAIRVQMRFFGNSIDDMNSASPYVRHTTY